MENNDRNEAARPPEGAVPSFQDMTLEEMDAFDWDAFDARMGTLESAASGGASATTPSKAAVPESAPVILPVPEPIDVDGRPLGSAGVVRPWGERDRHASVADADVRDDDAVAAVVPPLSSFRQPPEPPPAVSRWEPPLSSAPLGGGLWPMGGDDPNAPLEPWGSDSEEAFGDGAGDGPDPDDYYAPVGESAAGDGAPSGEDAAGSSVPVNAVPVSAGPAGGGRSGEEGAPSSAPAREPERARSSAAPDADPQEQGGGVGRFVAPAQTWFRAQSLGRRVLLVFVAVLLLLFLVMKACGSEAPSEPQSQASAEVVQTEGEPSPTAAGGSGSGILIPSEVDARCAAKSTDASLAFSSDKKDAWVCQRTNGIDGTTVTLTFRRPVVVSEVFLVPGFNYVEASGLDRWTQYRHVTRVLWKIGDTQIVQGINPVRTGVRKKIEDIATQQIELTIMQTVSPDEVGTGGVPGAGKKSDDAFAISQIQIKGHEA